MVTESWVVVISVTCFICLGELTIIGNSILSLWMEVLSFAGPSSRQYGMADTEHSGGSDYGPMEVYHLGLT